MTPFKLFLVRLFQIDPSLKEASFKTDKLEATLNGDSGWMLTCSQKVEHRIKCDDGNTYKRVTKHE